jgi:hypothetical protein
MADTDAQEHGCANDDTVEIHIRFLYSVFSKGKVRHNRWNILGRGGNGLTCPEVSILRMKNGMDEKSASGLQCAWESFSCDAIYLQI